MTVVGTAVTVAAAAVEAETRVTGMEGTNVPTESAARVTSMAAKLMTAS